MNVKQAEQIQRALDQLAKAKKYGVEEAFSRNEKATSRYSSRTWENVRVMSVTFIYISTT